MFLAVTCPEWSFVMLEVGSVSIFLMCVAFLLLSITVWKLKRNKERNHTQEILGPRGLPIFGNIFQLGVKIHETFMKIAEDYGDVFQIYIASRKVVVLNGSKAIHQALARQSIDFAGRPDFPSMSVLDETTGRGLSFSTYSDQWLLHRKISERALRYFTSGQQIDKLQKKVMLEVERLINFWTDNGKKKDIALSPERTLQLSVSNVIGSFLFNERHELDDLKLCSLLDLQSGFQDVFSTANMVDFMPWLLIIAPKLLEGFHTFLHRFKGTFEDVMTKHLKNHKPGADDDMMDYMLTLVEKTPNQGKITSALALSSTYDFFGAGADTVPATIMWLISYMVAYPDVQVKVHKEIDGALSGRTACLEDRCRLPFTRAVIAEVQRHSSVVALAIPHSTIKDTILEGGYNLSIPKDTIVFVNYYSVHYDARIFLEPNRFAPERFMKNGETINSDMISKLVAFGVGRRRCLGSELARVELFLYFVTLMQRFQFSCPDGETVSMKGKPGLVSKPTLGAVRLRERMAMTIDYGK